MANPLIEKALADYERIQSTLPGSPYANSVAKWLQTKSPAPAEAGCIGCHTGR